MVSTAEPRELEERTQEGSSGIEDKETVYIEPRCAVRYDGCPTDKITYRAW
jgi:hypothetical protein